MLNQEQRATIEARINNGDEFSSNERYSLLRSAPDLHLILFKRLAKDAFAAMKKVGEYVRGHFSECSVCMGAIAKIEDTECGRLLGRTPWGSLYLVGDLPMEEQHGENNQRISFGPINFAESAHRYDLASLINGWHDAYEKNQK
jgi:hypothetical protein